MLLSDKLTAIREISAKRIPPPAAAIMHRATEDLRSSGILNSVIKMGDPLPDFTLLNQNGIPTSSFSLLKQGPLILTVFRGSW